MFLRRMFNKIRNGRAFDKTGANGETCVTFAIKNNDRASLESFLQAGASPDVPNAAGEYPVHLALHDAQGVLLACLMDAGATLLCEQDGMYPSEHAATRGLSDIAGTLEKAEYQQMMAALSPIASTVSPQIVEPARRKKPQCGG